VCSRHTFCKALLAGQSGCLTRHACSPPCPPPLCLPACFLLPPPSSFTLSPPPPVLLFFHSLPPCSPGEELQEGLLWVAEQVPGLVAAADLTPTLAFGYFPSYNVPYFPEVRQIAGSGDWVVLVHGVVGGASASRAGDEPELCSCLRTPVGAGLLPGSPGPDCLLSAARLVHTSSCCVHPTFLHRPACTCFFPPSSCCFHPSSPHLPPFSTSLPPLAAFIPPFHTSLSASALRSTTPAATQTSCPSWSGTASTLASPHTGCPTRTLRGGLLAAGLCSAVRCCAVLS
jgi:hypothetical protein